MLVPLKKHILIEVPKVQEEKMSAGGIIVPEAKLKKAPQESGRVVAVGEEVTLVKEGDVVIFGKYNRSEISVNDDQYLVLTEDNLIAKII